MANDRVGIIGGEIVRAARALVHMSREEVAAAAGGKRRPDTTEDQGR